MTRQVCVWARWTSHAIRQLNFWMAVSSAFSAVVIMVLGAGDTIMTAMFGRPIPAATELASAFLAVSVFGAMAYAQQERQNIVVDIVAKVLPRSIQKFVEVLSTASGALIMGLIGWRAALSAIEAVNLRETAAAAIMFPVYPFKIVVAIALVVAALEFGRQFVEIMTGSRVNPDGRQPSSNFGAESAA
jgi:TRAP-type transport system small permease protein